MGDRNVDYNVLERILARSEGPRHLPLEILTSITDNFSEDRKIGSGGFSDVYKGVLHHWSVAVKRIRVDIHTMDEKLFIREVQSLLKIIDHPNVVRFLGFHSNTHHEVKENTGAEKRRLVEITERLLCFEYISSGSLEEYITDELRGLEWNIRYQIINGICEGLQYLHNKMGIIHMDLKPANIMVVVDNDNMLPKITDFGLARLVQNKYTTDGRFFSRGYCAPEYMNIGKPTLKCDICSLGIIIIEIITGRNDEMPIKDRVIRRWRCRWRKSATYTPLYVQQLTKCIEIAERCTQREPENRPSISHIIDDLNESANTNVYIPTANQVPSSDDDEMLGIEPLELRFAFELNKEISNAVELINETGNCIAFNFRTASQLKYFTQPNKGIVLARSKKIVNITLQGQGTTTLGSVPRADEFIVQSTKVVYGLTDDEITEDMFNEEAGKVVDEVNLTVVYDNGPEKPHADQSLEANAPVSKEVTCSSYQDVRLSFHPIETTSATKVSCQYKASERAAVDIMTGAMGGLLPKLGHLLKGEHNLPEDVKEDVESLEEQLTDMHTALCDLPHDEEIHKLGLQDKKWVNKVKNLSYDIEDMVDGLLISIEGSEPITNLDGFRSLVQKMLKRVRNVADRRKEVRLASMANRPVRSTNVDPRMLDWYKDHKYLVGIDGPRDSLVEKLTGGDDASKKKLKIISIFGEGGLGKTTLAKKLFDKLAANFVLKAFVPVGRNPDINRVLEDILYELDKKGNKDIHNAKKDQRQLTDLLRGLLENKRYFIVIDDIWDTESWDMIKCAFVNNDNGSRIMTTSRIYGVAKSSDEVCKLKPLSDHQSKQLFYARLTGKGTRTFDQPDEQSTKYILGKCGGLPLAIITIASLLGGKRVEDWPKVYYSIKFRHEDNKAENTKKILLFSYFDLPCHLKTCLLYLSIYPEDSVIEKRKLVWKWIAEGFVRQEKRKTLFEVGEGYFNELINRSLIQPVELNDYWLYHSRIETGTIVACRVHDMVLDLICSLAKEENFVTILDTDEQHLSSENNARILAVHKRSLQQHVLSSGYLCKQQGIRSFNASPGCHLSWMGLDTLLPSFRVLRVLSLEDCVGVSGVNAYRLKNVAQLRHLRCLSLAETLISKLPMEIGDLRCLQILDLMETNIEELPQSVTQLRELKSLFCYSHDQPVKLPEGMGSLTSLEELRLYLCTDAPYEYLYHSGDDLSDSNLELDFFPEERNRLTAVADSLKELGNLTELRVLQILTSRFSGSMNKALVESLNKLKKIEELDVCRFSDHKVFGNTMWDDYSPCKVLLRHLCLHSTEMPGWIDASLGNIIYLELHLTSLTERDLFGLGSLPELRCLDLRIGCADDLHGIVVADSADAFPKLRHLQTKCWLTFVQEAMQCLESLRLDIRVRGHVEFDFDSLQCLHSLEKVSARFYDTMKPVTKKATIKAALRRAVDNHHNGPILDLNYHSLHRKYGRE